MHYNKESDYDDKISLFSTWIFYNAQKYISHKQYVDVSKNFTRGMYTLEKIKNEKVAKFRFELSYELPCS